MFIGDDISEFIQHISSHDAHLINCAYCNYNTNLVRSFQTHLENEHVFDRYQCRACFYRSKHRGYVKHHLRTYHSKDHQDDSFDILNMPVCAKFKIKKPNFAEVECPGCAIKFMKLNLFQKHLEKHHQFDEIYCKLCNVKSSVAGFLDHLQMYHQISHFQCIMCSKAFQRTEEVTRHLIDHHPSAESLIYRREIDVSFLFKNIFICSYIIFLFRERIISLPPASCNKIFGSII